MACLSGNSPRGLNNHSGKHCQRGRVEREWLLPSLTVTGFWEAWLTSKWLRVLQEAHDCLPNLVANCNASAEHWLDRSTSTVVLSCSHQTSHGRQQRCRCGLRIDTKDAGTRHRKGAVKPTSFSCTWVQPLQPSLCLTRAWLIHFHNERFCLSQVHRVAAVTV